MERPPVMTVSETAKQRVLELIGKADKPVCGIKIGVVNKGCSGYKYDIQYAEEDLPTFESVSIDDKAKLYIDPMAIMYVIGSQLDWEEEKFSARFVIKNPNETGKCGCGESFSYGDSEGTDQPCN